MIRWGFRCGTRRTGDRGHNPVGRVFSLAARYRRRYVSPDQPLLFLSFSSNFGYGLFSRTLRNELLTVSYRPNAEYAHALGVLASADEPILPKTGSLWFVFPLYHRINGMLINMTNIRPSPSRYAGPQGLCSCPASMCDGCPSTDT
jgi:hypothetical protein